LALAIELPPAAIKKGPLTLRHTIAIGPLVRGAALAPLLTGKS